MQSKIDERIISLIKSSGQKNHRCFLILIGENSKKQITNIYKLLSANSTRPVDSIIWCHNEIDIEKKLSSEGNESELKDFLDMQNIQFISYKESDRILGQTVDLLILQNFESLTPNLIAMSIETVRGGGIVVLLLDNVNSIDSLVKIKPQFLVGSEFVPRFNKRLFRSLINSKFTIFLNHNLNVLSITKYSINSVNFELKEKIQTIKNKEIEDVDEVLLNICKTEDQRLVVESLFDLIKNRTGRFVYSIQAGRGRGKSVSLGLAITKAIDLRYSNIFVVSPEIENVKMVFSFIKQGLKSIGYLSYKDFTVTYKFKGKKRFIEKIEVFKNTRMSISYMNPFEEISMFPDMLIIDEAAAIPLPILKCLVFANIVVMATTNSGYEGTGKAFSTKMTEYFREQLNSDRPFVYKELFMNRSIRYGDNDPVENWLNNTLLLNTDVKKISKCPLPSTCNLTYVSRDTLFSGNSAAEIFLNDVFSLFVSSHYKNSPNDIQILADSPNHEIFTLITTVENDGTNIPRALCAIHISFEGKCDDSISKKGNLIPWIVSETYSEKDILSYYGVRVVRIAVHPDYMSMGYGSTALDLLTDFLVKNQNSCLTQLIKPIEEGNILLYETKDVMIPKLSWIGTSFGVTERLLNFWKTHSLLPICMKQTRSYITGEFSVILVKPLDDKFKSKIEEYYSHFKKRFIGQLGYSFRDLTSSICLTLMLKESCDREILENIKLSSSDILRLGKYSKGIIDILQIIDIVPLLARMYFNGLFLNKLTFLQQSILLKIGCQYKSLDEISKINNLKIYELNSIFIKIITILVDELSISNKSSII